MSNSSSDDTQATSSEPDYKGSKYYGLYCSELYGGEGGKAWNDGTYSNIREITVTEIEDTLTSVQFNYCLKGSHPSVVDKVFHGPAHGGTDGEPISLILSPGEYLLEISGYYYQLEGGPVIIKSLTFQTNQGSFGPFGAEEGTPFETQDGGNIVGFYGRATKGFVYSIGVYKMMGAIRRKAIPRRGS